MTSMTCKTWLCQQQGTASSSSATGTKQFIHDIVFRKLGNFLCLLYPCAELDMGLLNNPNKTTANPFIQLSPWGKTIRTENLWVVQWKWLNKMHDDHYKFHVTGKIVFSRENPCGIYWKWRFGSLWIQVSIGLVAFTRNIIKRWIFSSLNVR